MPLGYYGHRLSHSIFSAIKAFEGVGVTMLGQDGDLSHTRGPRYRS